MNPHAHDFLIDWAMLACWLLALAALTCAYFVGRLRGQLAERRAVVKAAVEREVAAAVRRLVPAQREGER